MLGPSLVCLLFCEVMQWKELVVRGHEDVVISLP